VAERIATAMLILAAIAIPRPVAAASIAAGKALFARCAICHTIAAGAGARVGPDLHGIFGRRAGSGDNFTYSAALQHSGIVWDDKTLAAYLKNPRQFIPGNAMAFPGIQSDTDIADLLAYLHQAAE
jgi:cytochrome c